MTEPPQVPTGRQSRYHRFLQDDSTATTSSNKMTELFLINLLSVLSWWQSFQRRFPKDDRAVTTGSLRMTTQIPQILTRWQSCPLWICPLPPPPGFGRFSLPIHRENNGGTAAAAAWTFSPLSSRANNSIADNTKEPWQPGERQQIDK